MSEMVLRCEDLVKQYKDKKALDNVSLTLEKGKIYGLIGRNGAGKTTLLSILTAQNPATHGTVTLAGQPVWENESSLSHLCFSREINANANNGGIGGLKIKDYLKMAETYMPHWDKAMAEHLLNIFHLDRKKRISKLSKGMTSMITIIVALASKAEFTLLDEPVAGLDVVAREQFYRILLEEYTETGRTFVISTHIIEEAADLFEEVIILHDGRMILKENTQELLESCVHVSGKEEDVDVATAGLVKYREESIGRSKSVTVRLGPGQRLESTEHVTVQPMNLQKIFVAMCGGEV